MGHYGGGSVGEATSDERQATSDKQEEAMVDFRF